jgi:hypothetical protein
LFAPYPKKGKKILNSLIMTAVMVTYFSVRNCMEPLAIPNNFKLNCPFKNSDTDSEPLTTSGSDPGPGPALDKNLHFCSAPYSGWRKLSSKFYSTLNRLNLNIQGINNSNYSYLTLYLCRSRDMDELDEYMRWLEGDDEAMDNIRNQTPTEPPTADATPAPEGGDPAPCEGGEEEEEEEVMVLDPPAPDDLPDPTPPGHTSSSAANTKVNEIKDNNSCGSQHSDNSLSSQDTAGTFCTVYSKYGTRESNVLDIEQTIDSNRAPMSSAYHQCKEARAASRLYNVTSVEV